MGTLVKNNRNSFPVIPSFLDEMMTSDWLDWPFNKVEKGTVPAVNVRETNDAFELEVAAPGMDKQDFKVNLDNNLLIISAEKQNQPEGQHNQGHYTRQEFNYHSFMRTFSLPGGMVLGDQITARYYEGILYVTVPKTEEARVKPPKQIEIS